ncbi:MAG: GyrI-like domain-containing protein [Acidimicrobiales bacterium]|nr:GyrI-like domain-containing protein [Acidimicrobiales bacterium]
MADISPTIVELDPQQAVAVRGNVAVNDMPRFFERAFVACFKAAGEAGIDIAGPPFGFYPGMPGETVVIEAGFPVSAPIAEMGDVHPLELPGGKAVEVIHVGPFEAMKETYAALQTWMAEKGLQPAAGMWEIYLTDPQTEPDQSKWQTKIVWPISS